MKKIDILYLILGTFLTALSFTGFFIPNAITPGGVSGFATLINALFPVLSVGGVILVCNLPIFIFGWKKHGRKFMIYSLVSTILLSILIEVLYMPTIWIEAIQSDLLLSSVMGGVVMGLGIGLVLKGGFTTGGTDMLAVIIHDRFPNIRISWVLFGIDFLVVVSTTIFLTPLLGLYSLVALFIASKVMDFVQTGIDSAKAFTIISDKSKEISHRILTEMDRGITFLNGSGGFTEDEKKIILCVVDRRQIARLRSIIKDIDEDAFVIIYDVKEVVGEGFTGS